MYAFLSHQSACEALRMLAARAPILPRWPQEPRELPRHYNCVTTQRMFKDYAATVDLPSHGIVRRPIDLLVPKASQRSRGASALFHAWKTNLPARSTLRLEETLFCSTPEFVLLQMASYHNKVIPIADRFGQEMRATREAYAAAGITEPVPYDNPFTWDLQQQVLRMVLVACEFMGTYRLAVADRPTRYQLPALMTGDSMRDMMGQLPRIYGRNRLELALSLAFRNSASPMETLLALMLSLPEAYGGYGLPRPELNRSLPVHDHERLWSGGPSITPDLLYQDWSLALEYESDEFHGSQGEPKAARDVSRANVLSAMGYSVIRVVPELLASEAEAHRIAGMVASRMGKTIPEPDEALRVRRSNLHKLLMG